MKDLIEVFRMTELPVETRINIIIKLGNAVNHEYSMNLTEPIVLELVKALDSNHSITKNEHYLRIK